MPMKDPACVAIRRLQVERFGNVMEGGVNCRFACVGLKTWPFSLQTSRSSCIRRPTPLIELELAKQQRDPMVEGDDEGCLCDEMVEMQALELTKVPDLVY